MARRILPLVTFTLVMLGSLTLTYSNVEALSLHKHRVRKENNSNKQEQSTQDDRRRPRYVVLKDSVLSQAQVNILEDAIDRALAAIKKGSIAEAVEDLRFTVEKLSYDKNFNYNERVKIFTNGILSEQRIKQAITSAASYAFAQFHEEYWGIQFEYVGTTVTGDETARQAFEIANASGLIEEIVHLIQNATGENVSRLGKNYPAVVDDHEADVWAWLVEQGIPLPEGYVTRYPERMQLANLLEVNGRIQALTSGKENGFLVGRSNKDDKGNRFSIPQYASLSVSREHAWLYKDDAGNVRLSIYEGKVVFLNGEQVHGDIEVLPNATLRFGDFFFVYLPENMNDQSNSPDAPPDTDRDKNRESPEINLDNIQARS